ncbi:A/G-specific adenine glycosylase [Winogradskyella ursingii]|uniref:A/G-specific adenine glycosylase n=1 Tax=Winogradskyella ursingii TaxID=2686079 RepID=UPI0015CDF3FE|nr:A/G-specific adenine glycosylase [Winogradskyella ursingii]
MKITQELIIWYSNNKRELPWRNTMNPYYIYLSEIILQQTQVKQGLPYYNAFVKKFPTVFDLANATEHDVLKLWQGLGYYSRARNLHTTAKHVASDLNGVFPDNYKDLIKLKGVGDYTASAIASFAFNKVEAVVDGNVYRVLSRYFGIDTPINSSKGIKEFKHLASTLIDQSNPGEYNQAIMEFGAVQCTPKNPRCSVCPLNTGCMALQKKKVDVLPVKLKKTKVTTKYYNFLVCIDSQNRIMFEKRNKKGIWQNLYQFPLVESEKSLKSTEFHQLDLNNTPLSGLEFDYSLYNEVDVLHKLSHRNLYTKFWIVETKHLPETAIPIDSLKNYPTPILISNFIDAFNFPDL